MPRLKQSVLDTITERDPEKAEAMVRHLMIRDLMRRGHALDLRVVGKPIGPGLFSLDKVRDNKDYYDGDTNDGVDIIVQHPQRGFIAFCGRMTEEGKALMQGSRIVWSH